MTIDTHTHYVPQKVLTTLLDRASDFGMKLEYPGGADIPAIHFDYGQKVRPFFPKLVESVEERLAGDGSDGCSTCCAQPMDRYIRIWLADFTGGRMASPDE